MATENDPGAIALKDFWDLIGAAVDLPEWADPLEVEGWVREMAGPLSRIVADLASRVQAVADKVAADKTKGWEQLLPVFVPLVVEIITAWRRRRQSDVPSPSPTNV